MPRVTAVVLNYNGRALLEVVLPTLAGQEYRDFQVVVVDDCSSDDSVEWLGREWPGVRVVGTGPVNVNVAAALNVAVRAAEGSEFVALLNNDIELDARWLGELVAALDAHPQAATAAGKLLSYQQRELIDAAGDVFSVADGAHGRGHGELDRGQYDREEDVFAPTAGAALYRLAAFADVGVFDESFCAYFEDVDWGLRAQLAGWRSRYVPTAVGWHMGSATTGGDRNPKYYELQRRNLIGVLVKGMPRALLLRHSPTLARRQLGAILDSARRRMLLAHLRALRGAAARMPRWLRARRTIQAARRVSDAELRAVLSE